jgi:DNA-binding NarL/FixJ family response regulator
VAHRAPVVAVLNTNDDVVEMLRTAIEQAGMVAVSAHVDDLRRGRTSPREFFEEHNPDVIVYDIVPPYDRSWMFLRHLQDMPGMRRRQWVLTSANPKRAMEQSGSSDQVLEILGKPLDLDEITQAVREAAKARPTRD